MEISAKNINKILITEEYKELCKLLNMPVSYAIEVGATLSELKEIANLPADFSSYI